MGRMRFMNAEQRRLSTFAFHGAKRRADTPA